MKIIAVDYDQAALDLVVHFLGLATHDNINAAPSSKRELADNSAVKVLRDSKIQEADSISLVCRNGRHLAHLCGYCIFCQKASYGVWPLCAPCGLTKL